MFMLDDLLLDDFLAKFELIDTVNEVVFWHVVAGAGIRFALHSCGSSFPILHDFWETEDLVLPQDYKSDVRDILSDLLFILDWR